MKQRSLIMNTLAFVFIVIHILKVWFFQTTWTCIRILCRGVKSSRAQSHHVSIFWVRIWVGGRYLRNEALEKFPGPAQTPVLRLHTSNRYPVLQHPKSWLLLVTLYFLFWMLYSEQSIRLSRQFWDTGIIQMKKLSFEEIRKSSQQVMGTDWT